jgi:histidinol-phosphate aminotransferase
VPLIPRARPNVERMSGYTPGEQPRPGERVIKLNTNENPFPPSPAVMEAIHSIDAERLRRYPNPSSEDFRKTAARVHGVSPDMIIAGNGSDEILAMVVRTYLGPGEVLATPDPTYSLYPVLADIGDVQVAPVPWAANFDLPVDALLATRPRAIFFANPNAPTGTLVSADRIRALASRFSGLLLIDEAYVDFADHNSLPLLLEFPHLVITRTLSKGYALAGLRFGYAVAAPDIVAEMNKVKDSYNCDAVAIAAATAALDDQAYARRSWQHVRQERARLSLALERLGWQVIPSQANFVLATCPSGDAGAIYRKLKAQGILVRFFDKPGLADKLRITLGTADDNDRVLAALAAP